MKTQTKFTKGEWIVRKTSTGWIVDAIQKPVQMFSEATREMVDDHVPTIQIAEFDSVSVEAEKNAKLIASAPGLYKELRNMVDSWDADCFTEYDINYARAILDKATS